MASYKLELNTPNRNVFVTQLREEDDEEKSNVNKYPIVQESSSKLVSTGIKTLQSTLLIKQNTEAEKLQEELEKKRQAYQEKMSACKSKEGKLKKRQQQIKERVNKFDKFIKDTEAKRRRALEKYQKENRLREQKTRELEIYTHELNTLRQRQIELQKRVEKCSSYEKYLVKVLEIIPEDYIENSSDSMLLGIMMRFKTLSSTNQLLTDALTSKTDEVKVQQQIIQDIEQQHNQQLLIDSSELASLQHQLENQTEGNARQEHSLQTRGETYRNQSTILGKVKLAVTNIAEKCTKKHSAPLLANMDTDDMLNLIKEFTREHEDICRMAGRSESPLGPGNAATNETWSSAIPKKVHTSLMRKTIDPAPSKNATQPPNTNSQTQTKRGSPKCKPTVHAAT